MLNLIRKRETNLGHWLRRLKDVLEGIVNGSRSRYQMIDNIKNKLVMCRDEEEGGKERRVENASFAVKGGKL